MKMQPAHTQNTTKENSKAIKLKDGSSRKLKIDTQNTVGHSSSHKPTIDTKKATKENFKTFILKDDPSCKLEFVNSHLGYTIKYCDEELDIYNTDNPDLLIQEFLEALAEYNGGDPKNVKTRLEYLAEEKSVSNYSQYPNTYKNSLIKYLIGLENNIVKYARIEQKLTCQQLANAIGVSESSLRSSVSKNKVSKQIEKSIEMFLRIAYLEKEIEKNNHIKSALKSWLN